MVVTVAICTWNRARLLDLTLAEMAKLQVPKGVEWELIIVNNNCTDDTDEVIKKHSAVLPVRRLFEAVPGKSFAANAALAAASGELIVWTDDDVLVSHCWLTEYVRAHQSWPDAAFFGGTITPFFEAAPPPWIQDNLQHLEGAIVIRQLGAATRRLESTEYPFGANMAFSRRSTRDQKFDTTIGPQAGRMFGNEEYQYIEDLRAAGHYGVWVGGASVQHVVPARRMTEEFLARWCEDVGTGLARRTANHSASKLFGVPRWCIRAYVEAEAALWWARLRGGHDWVEPFMRQKRLKGMLREWRRLACEPTGS